MARKTAKPVNVEYDKTLALEIAQAAVNDEGLYVPQLQAAQLRQLTFNNQPCFIVDETDTDVDPDSNLVLVSIVGTQAAIDMFIGQAAVGQSAAAASEAVVGSQPAAVGVAKGFQVYEGIVRPKSRRVGNPGLLREAIYPWADLLPGQSIFVAERMNETTGKPVSVKSAVSAVNAKIAKSTQDKSFVSFAAVSPDDANVKGEFILCEPYHTPRARSVK